MHLCFAGERPAGRRRLSTPPVAPTTTSNATVSLVPGNAAAPFHPAGIALIAVGVGFFVMEVQFGGVGAYAAVGIAQPIVTARAFAMP